MKIPFNKPFLTGNETLYIENAVKLGHISGNGKYTKLCQSFFENKYNIKKTLLTTSCTDALEMSALLINIKKDDEIIVPSYTFVSTALAFAREGAKIVFADSRRDHPGIDEEKIEHLITPKTKALVVVHYAGVAVDMDKIMSFAKKHNLFIIEDAAQAIDSFYKGKPLGGIGDLGAFSFHETKNIISGEGGLLTVNNEEFRKRSEIIWEKGTNRSSFFRGEVDKYGWVDTGSSFLPNELTAAFLYAQLENIEKIQSKRKKIWQIYYEELQELEKNSYIKLPYIPDYATNNAHMFYMICNSLEERKVLIKFLKTKGIHTVFHYLSLHKSPYYSNYFKNIELPMSDYYTDRLLRLPFYYKLKDNQVRYISEQIRDFYEKN